MSRIPTHRPHVTEPEPVVNTSRSRRLATALVAGAALVSPLAFVGPAHAESIATVGAHSVFAAEGPSHSLDVWWQSGIGGAYKKQVIPGAQAYSAPRVIIDDNMTVVVVEGAQNTLFEYSEPLGSKIWTPDIVAGQNSTYAAPSIAAMPPSGDDNGSLEVVAEGPGNTLFAYRQLLGLTDWVAQDIGGSGSTWSLPSVANSENSIVVAAKGPGPTLDFYWETIGTTVWHLEVVASSGIESAPTVSSVVPPQGGAQSVDIAVEGVNNQLWVFSQPVGGNGWTVDLAGAALTTYSYPTIIQAGGSMVVTALGPNNSLTYFYNPIGTSTFNEQEVIGAADAYSAPAIAVLAPGKGATDSIEIADQGPNDSLYEYRQVFFTAPWLVTLVARSGSAFA